MKRTAPMVQVKPAPKGLCRKCTDAKKKKGTHKNPRTFAKYLGSYDVGTDQVEHRFQCKCGSAWGSCPNLLARFFSI